MQSTLIFIGVSEYPLGSILVNTLLEFNIFHPFFFGSLDHLKQFTVCGNKLAILVGKVEMIINLKISNPSTLLKGEERMSSCFQYYRTFEDSLRHD